MIVVQIMTTDISDFPSRPIELFHNASRELQSKSTDEILEICDELCKCLVDATVSCSLILSQKYC
jgi:hypothetical protein